MPPKRQARANGSLLRCHRIRIRRSPAGWGGGDTEASVQRRRAYGIGESHPATAAERPDQHSTMFTARPPRAVSLYLIFISAPVSIIVLITLSRLTVCR